MSLPISAGWYIYIETSWPRKQNDTARLVSPEIPSAAQMCLQFWYHMYGSHVANLTVARWQGTTRKPLWTKTGTQGDRWRHATLDVSSSTKFKVTIGLKKIFQYLRRERLRYSSDTDLKYAV